MRSVSVGTTAVCPGTRIQQLSLEKIEQMSIMFCMQRESLQAAGIGDTQPAPCFLVCLFDTPSPKGLGQKIETPLQ